MFIHLEKILSPRLRTLAWHLVALRGRWTRGIVLPALVFTLTSFVVGPSLTVPARAADFTVGEIRRINKETKKITLRHGEIKSLEMPAMTMAFAVRDPKMLEDLKVGDKVRFQAIKDPSGELIVTVIRPVQ